jgi:hypothetical protein
MDTLLRGTMGTAIQSIPGLDAVPYDLAAAMGADRRQGVDRALETIEDMRLATHSDLETFIVGIAADLTGRVLFP